MASIHPALPPPPPFPAPSPPHSSNLSPIVETSESTHNSWGSPHNSHSSQGNHDIEEYHNAYAKDLEHIENSFAGLMETVEERIQESIEDNLQDFQDINHESITKAMKRIEEVATTLCNHMRLMEHFIENTDGIFRKIQPYGKLISSIYDDTANIKKKHEQLVIDVGNMNRRLHLLEKQVIADQIAANDQKVERERREHIAERKRKAQISPP